MKFFFSPYLTEEYPIWWFIAPMAVCSFLEHYDLTGKTVVPFCTAQDNGIDVSMEYIWEVSQGADVTDGYRFTAGTTEEDIRSWLEKIGISVKESIQEENRIPDGADQAMDREKQGTAAPADITAGTQSRRGFFNDNTLHSSIGDIHYSSYIPESYDGSGPYALFIYHAARLGGAVFSGSRGQYGRGFRNRGRQL